MHWPICRSATALRRRWLPKHHSPSIDPFHTDSGTTLCFCPPIHVVLVFSFICVLLLAAFVVASPSLLGLTLQVFQRKWPASRQDARGQRLRIYATHCHRHRHCLCPGKPVHSRVAAAPCSLTSSCPWHTPLGAYVYTYKRTYRHTPLADAWFRC